MAISAQGLTFTFGTATLSVTSVSVNDSQELQDATDLGVAPGGNRIYVSGFATDREVTIDYFDSDILTAGATGALTIAGPISFTGTATISNSTLTASVGDLVRGTATFRVVS
jgi:hypothetical protein